MDTSQENLKMCEKAVEIQETWNQDRLDSPCAGDIFCQYIAGELTGPYIKTNKKPYGKNTFWLPSQDQLQKILLGDTQDAVANLVTNFYSWFTENGCYEWSMEQLWLGYLYAEKYNKCWDGTDWIKEARHEN